jgi:hypothetical protein
MKIIKTRSGYNIKLDNEFFYKLNKHTWYRHDAGKYNKSYYARTRIGNKLVYMHHMIIGKAPKGYVVDHINGSGLDNRIKNLRFIKHSHNIWKSRKVNMRTTSKYKGVWYRKERGAWAVCLHLDDKTKHFGYYATEKEAAKVYNKMAKRYYGKFAVLNKI